MENITIQKMNLSKLLMIGFIITCMKEIREDLELRHHMKLEMRHSLYKHQINIQYLKIKE